MVYLNKFYENIKFTYEAQHNVKISFLDLLLTRNDGKLEMIVFRKETNKDIYLHGGLLLLLQGIKVHGKGTLIRHAYTVCFNDNLLQKELHHIEMVLTEINCYSKWLLKQTLGSFKTNNKNYPTNINN